MVEGAAGVGIGTSSVPAELDEIRRRIMQLEIERVSVAREADDVSRERLARLDTELAELREKSAGLQSQWQAEKAAIMTIGKIKDETEAARAAMADQDRRRARP